jgi:hypothetical protein
MNIMRELFTNYLNGGSKPVKKSTSFEYTRTQKKEKLGKRTYVLYKKGK